MAPATTKESSSLSDQFAAAAVGAINDHRIADEALQLVTQEAALAAALGEIRKVRDFIGVPEKILGSAQTKHGEIAEWTEVGVRRARDCLAGTNPAATFEEVPRTAPADYLIDGIEVQSKFINGANNTLSHVLEHMGKYENFGRDGSFYHIPKDQHELILKVIKGEVEGLKLNEKSIKAILSKVSEIEAATGQKFEDVVQPSVSGYAEVQQGAIHQTLDNHENDLKEESEALKGQIRADHEPSLAEGLKATGVAAAVGASVGFVAGSIKKYTKEGKNIFKGDFTAKDWKEVGGETLKGGLLGGVSGGAIYALTNYAALSAPLAGAFVAAVKGLAPLVSDYRAGKLSFDALVDGGMLVCSDVALVGVCTVAGQTLIPVPVLGAVLGSIAGKVLSKVLSGQLEGLQAAVDARMASAMARLDAAYQSVVATITAEFERLGDLTRAAFDLSLNEKLVERSLELARAYGVEDVILMKNEADLDAYMLS